MKQLLKSGLNFSITSFQLVCSAIVVLLSLATVAQCEDLPQLKSLTIEAGILHWKEKKLDNGNVLLTNIWLFRSTANQWVRVIGPWGPVENFRCLKMEIVGGARPSPEMCALSLYESKFQALRICRFAGFNFSQNLRVRYLDRPVLIVSETGAIARVGPEIDTLNVSQLDKVECTNNPTPPSM